MKSNAQKVVESVKDLVDGVVEREGYELLDVEMVTERGRAILRLYIDTIPPGTHEQGVTIEDCTHVSRTVGDILDVEDAVPGEYNLEVSSPGLYRPLTKPQHFDRALGQRVKVKTYEKRDERRIFTGTLAKREGEAITVDVDGTPFEIPLREVAKAHLDPVLDF